MGKSNPFKALMADDASYKDKSVKLMMLTESGSYRLGEASRPNIYHDNGHLDKHSTREPTPADRALFAGWVAALEASEAARPWLVDAHSAYRHFLFGKGKDRRVAYDRYIANDPAGQKLLKLVVADFIFHAEKIGENRKNFSLTSNVFGVGPGKFAPHPLTENWVKTLGQHVFWVSATVIVSVNRESKIRMDAELLIRAEDKYNFNPGDSDIATGIPDSANGRFEVCGLANQYMNYGEIRRMISWTKGVTDSVMVEGASSKVPDAPSDSRYGDR